MGSPRVSTLVARGRAAAMEEESFFVSADEAEEGEAAHRDARRVGDGKGAVSYTHLTLPTILLV